MVFPPLERRGGDSDVRQVKGIPGPPREICATSFLFSPSLYQTNPSAVLQALPPREIGKISEAGKE
jgi:hypothetical protein